MCLDMCCLATSTKSLLDNMHVQCGFIPSSIAVFAWQCLAERLSFTGALMILVTSLFFCFVSNIWKTCPSEAFHLLAGPSYPTAHFVLLMLSHDQSAIITHEAMIKGRKEIPARVCALAHFTIICCKHKTTPPPKNAH